jgi:tetratricopeptide (TPR) repeat protein
LKVRLEPASAQADLVLGTSGQRDQRELAAFHLDRGRRFYERENDREAIAEVRRAIYLSPYLPEAHVLLGKLYLRAGRANDAIGALKIAVWSEDTVGARLALAEAYEQARQYDAARLEAERALALQPDLPAAREFLQRLPPRR